MAVGRCPTVALRSRLANARSAPRQCASPSQREFRIVPPASPARSSLRPRSRCPRHRPVRADDYPSRPVRVIVPFSPGGAVDGPMRADRAGAVASAWASRSSSRTSPAPARRSAPTSSPRRRPTATRCCSRRRPTRSARRCTRSSPFDPIEDFAPISLIGREPGVLVVNPALPVKTLQRVHRVREGAARPGRLRVVGQRQRPAPVRGAARVDDRHEDEPRARTSGSGQATTDLLGGRRADVDSRHRRHGRPHQGRQAARAGGDRRDALAAAARRADGDGSRRAGLRGLRLDGTAGAEGHAAGDHRAAATAKCVAVLGDDEVKRYMATAGIEIVGSTPAEFGAFFRAREATSGRRSSATPARKID